MPEPEGPSKAVIFPAGMSSEIFSAATKLPFRVVYTLLRSCTWATQSCLEGLTSAAPADTFLKHCSREEWNSCKPSSRLSPWVLKMHGLAYPSMHQAAGQAFSAVSTGLVLTRTRTPLPA